MLKTTLCRRCSEVTETVEHIVDCGHSDEVLVNVDAVDELSDLTQVQLIRWANRIQNFYDAVEN